MSYNFEMSFQTRLPIFSRAFIQFILFCSVRISRLFVAASGGFLSDPAATSEQGDVPHFEPLVRLQFLKN